jgi:hypothetical protein
VPEVGEEVSEVGEEEVCEEEVGEEEVCEEEVGEEEACEEVVFANGRVFTQSENV